MIPDNFSAPFVFRPGPSKSKSLFRSLLRRWKALKAGSRDDEVCLPLEPLGFWPGRSSALICENGAPASPLDGYAFHTRYVPSTGGRISFRVKLVGLVGTRGKLLISINGINQNGQPLMPKIEKFDLDQLARGRREIEVSTVALFENSYAVTGTLIGSDAQVASIEVTVTGADSDDAYIARLEAAQRGFLSAPGQGSLADIVVNRKATLLSPVSQMCTASQMREPIYDEICAEMGEAPKLHRKQWEFAYIIRALTHHGALRKGARGLGFGVGVEPLSSIFARAGCDIVATDLPADDDRASVWHDTAQLSTNLRQIFHERLCDEQQFFGHVIFRPVDMNAIPNSLSGFDFTWSSCAYEHLGSIEAGLAFFENSLNCLAPGGLAVHTTEINLSSNDGTLDRGSTVIFRRRDFEQLAARLISLGHEVFPITFDTGQEDLDRIIDLPPYSNDPHLKLALMRWVSTSFGMIVRKAR